MLHYFCAIALLITQAAYQGNYFVGKFQGTFPWAYPFDICAPSGLLVFPPVMYTCSADGKTVTEMVYAKTDTTCSGTVSKTLKYNASTAMSNGTYQFFCNGTTDYMAVKLYVGACGSATTATVYNAINSCFQLTQRTNGSIFDIYQQTQCTYEQATISTYASSAYPIYDTYCSGVNTKLEGEAGLNTTCAYYLTSAGEKVFAEMTDCVYDGYTQFPQTWNNSASFTNSKTTVQTIQLSAVLAPATDTLADPKLCGIDWFTTFEGLFNGSYVEVGTECIAEAGAYDPYSWIAIAVEVDVYTTYYYNCTALTAQLAVSILEITGTNLEVITFSCNETNYPYPTTTAPAPMKAVSLFVFVVSLLASFLM